MRGAGFTLVELMVGVVLIGMVAGTVLHFSTAVHRSNRLVAGYVTDLDQCRRALRQVEDDLREAQRVERQGASVRVHRGGRAIDYRLNQGRLERVEDSGLRVVARRIAAFEVEQDGRLARVRLALQPRAPSPQQRAEVFAAVCLREGGGR